MFTSLLAPASKDWNIFNYVHKKYDDHMADKYKIDLYYLNASCKKANKTVVNEITVRNM